MTEKMKRGDYKKWRNVVCCAADSQRRILGITWIKVMFSTRQAVSELDDWELPKKLLSSNNTGDLLKNHYMENIK